MIREKVLIQHVVTDDVIIFGEQRFRSIADNSLDLQFKNVSLPVLRKHKFNSFMKSSVYLPLASSLLELHSRLWALESPTRANGLGKVLTILTRSSTSQLNLGR